MLKKALMRRSEGRRSRHEELVIKYYYWENCRFFFTKNAITFHLANFSSI
jgi:hypothetical protein